MPLGLRGNKYVLIVRTGNSFHSNYGWSVKNNKLSSKQNLCLPVYYCSLTTNPKVFTIKYQNIAHISVLGPAGKMHTLRLTYMSLLLMWLALSMAA